MGWGTVDAVWMEGREKDEAAEVVKMAVGEEQNENIWLVVALGCMSWKCLHWLSRREALHFYSAQVVSMGSRQ